MIPPNSLIFFRARGLHFLTNIMLKERQSTENQTPAPESLRSRILYALYVPTIAVLSAVALALGIHFSH